ncbi:MAG: hypothetical protein ACRD9S_15845 [Pyrinomonadaceae bacterium]
MSPFKQDILKILLDKFLLGLIAAAFGFYLARLLEDYRTRNAYQLIVLKERVDAYRKLLEVVTEHHQAVDGLFGFINTVIEKYPNKVSNKEMEPGYAYIKFQKEFMLRMAPLMAHVSLDVVKALGAYLDETNKVSNVVKQDFSLGKPDQQKIDEAFLRFVHACALTVAVGPFGGAK